MTDNSNAAPERYGDLERNRLLNQCSCDLEGIIYGHDPQIHNLNNRVWDRLDRLAMDIEARAAYLASAQVAAAYEDAANEARSFGGDCVSQWHIGYSAACGDIDKAIRALTPDDASAALNAMLKAERAKAYEAAALLAAEYPASTHGCLSSDPFEAAEMAAEEIAAAIRALAQEDE